jgi:hypothetical protein
VVRFAPVNSCWIRIPVRTASAFFSSNTLTTLDAAAFTSIVSISRSISCIVWAGAVTTIAFVRTFGMTYTSASAPDSITCPLAVWNRRVLVLVASPLPDAVPPTWAAVRFSPTAVWPSPAPPPASGARLSAWRAACWPPAWSPAPPCCWSPARAASPPSPPTPDPWTVWTNHGTACPAGLTTFETSVWLMIPASSSA